MITGEIKRHFRDATWDIHVPRRMQELSGALRPAEAVLSQRLGRDPTVDELADCLQTTSEEVVDALEASWAYRSTSLDVPSGLPDGDGATLGDLLGADDPAFGLVTDREALKPLLAELGERDKRIAADAVLPGHDAGGDRGRTRRVADADLAPAEPDPDAPAPRRRSAP
jgi:RNA polymerase sigma-B factor